MIHGKTTRTLKSLISYNIMGTSIIVGRKGFLLLLHVRWITEPISALQIIINIIIIIFIVSVIVIVFIIIIIIIIIVIVIVIIIIIII